MRRLLSLLCLLVAACSSAGNPNSPRNAPTLYAPSNFVEAQQPVTLNNVANLKYLGRLDQPGTVSTLFSYALSPDATRLAALNNEQLLAWNLLDGTLLFQTARSDATRLFYSSDKTELYVVDADGLTVVHDANTGAVKTSFPGQTNYANVSAFSPDDGWLALGGSDGTVKLWDTYARQALATINAHETAVTALAFSPDGTQLASAGSDGVIRLWNWRDRTKTAETALDKPILVNLLSFSPDGSLLAVGTDRDARLWSTANPQQINLLDVGHGGASQILTFSPEGRYLIAGNPTAGLSLWNSADHALAARLPSTQGDRLSAAFSPDGNLLVTSVLNGQVSLWNLVQVSAQTVNQAELKLGTQQILHVEWSDDSRLLMFFDASGPVYLWGIGAS